MFEDLLPDGKHDHPACKTEQAHKHEKAFTENSLGGESTQNCNHYSERIVVEDNAYAQTVEDYEEHALTQHIIIGEVLNTPRFRCKKRY